MFDWFLKDRLLLVWRSGSSWLAGRHQFEIPPCGRERRRNGHFHQAVCSLGFHIRKFQPRAVPEAILEKNRVGASGSCVEVQSQLQRIADRIYSQKTMGIIWVRTREILLEVGESI